MKIDEHQWGNFTTFEKRFVIVYLRYLHTKCILKKPPICFAIRTSLLISALIFIFPLEPMTIPAVLGAALSINIIISSI